MTSTQRIVTNTLAQYIRTVINVCLSLYSTRLILSALGQTDYGMYSVVAGVVTMLSFMTNALISTTQRYLSFNHGRGDKKTIYQVFGNSVLLHFLLGIGLIVLLCLLAYPVIFSMLNIESGRETAAFSVYISAAIMLFFTFVTAPFRSLFIARENIVYISIIDVLDGILKVVIAIFLMYIVSYDKLIFYSLLLIGIALFNFGAFAIYALHHFEECHIPRWSEWNNQYIKDLSSFAGWTIYSTGCIIARVQGIAVLLNRFFGSAVNAAYGIAQQVVGATNFIAQSVLNSMSPQIIKAEGNANREQMLHLSESASKYATLLMALVVIPLVFEMPTILELWLKEVPENTIMFCRFVLIAAVCDQLTIGLGIANQAIGNIRNYSLIVNTIKVLSLPSAWLCLRYGLPAVYTMYCYLTVEIICALARLPFLKISAGLSIRSFVKNVFVKSFFSMVVMILTCFVMINIMNDSYRFVWTIMTSIILGGISIWFCSLSEIERQVVRDMINKKNTHS